MDNFDKMSELFEGTAGESLLRSQLAMLDLYEQWTKAGALDSGTMNEMIKSAMGAHLALFRATGEMGQQLRGMQSDWISSYRDMLNEQLRKNAAGAKAANEEQEDTVVEPTAKEETPAAERGTR